LRLHLDEAWATAGTGAVHVITRYRDSNQNLRTQFRRIIRRAGLEPWERLFQNLRASRETELAAEYPVHVVTKWIGNSVDVAMKHYFKVTDADFARASGALHKAVQALHGSRERQSPAVGRGESESSENADSRRLVKSAASYCQDRPVRPTG